MDSAPVEDCDGVFQLPVLLWVNGEGGTRILSKVQNSQGTGKCTARENGSYQPPWKAGFGYLRLLALGIQQLPESC